MIGALIGAALIGVSLGLLGSGGSILTVPILVYMVGHEEKSSIAESLAIVGIISLFGAVRRAKSREVHWRSVLTFGPASMAAGLLGAHLSRHVPGPVQLVILAVIMLGAAVMMVRPPKLNTGDIKKPNVAALVLAGASVGLITGLIGIGGGFLIVPALVLGGGLLMQSAIGTSLMLISLNCAVTFAKHVQLIDDQRVILNWQTILLFAGLGIAGSLVGQSIGTKLSQRVLRRIFAIFIVLIAVFIFVREIPKLRHTQTPIDSTSAPLSGVVGSGRELDLR